MKVICFYQLLIKLINCKKIFICATEQSGDNIGFNIINELLINNDNLIFEGVGGQKMMPLLNKQFYSLKDFNTMGIFEIFFSIIKYIKMIKFLSKIILKNKYDLVITIDSPDFNYPLAKKIKNDKFDNKIIHVVAPSVWAWRSYRAKNFAKVYDKLLVLFEFEIKYFVKYGLNTKSIGHPIYYTNKIANNTNADTDTNTDTNIVFLPGSRLGEIKSLFLYFTLAYKEILKSSIVDYIFIPTLPHLESEIKKMVSNWRIKVVVSTNLDIIESNYASTTYALVCSGTASLEIAKRNIPQLIIYKLNFFTELLAKNFIKIKYANIINIIENKIIIPEITNSNLNKKSFLNAFSALLNDTDSNIKQIKNINKTINKIIKKEPPYEVAAKEVYEFLY